MLLLRTIEIQDDAVATSHTRLDGPRSMYGLVQSATKELSYRDRIRVLEAPFPVLRRLCGAWW
jgi:hypothetical protein